MKISKSYKNKKLVYGFFIVKDVKAKELKDLDIKYTILRNGYNYEFLIKKEYLNKCLSLVEPKFRDFWEKEIKKLQEE